eukprot:gene17714-24073_t
MQDIGGSREVVDLVLSEEEEEEESEQRPRVIIAVDPAATERCAACVLDADRCIVRSLIATHLRGESEERSRKRIKGGTLVVDAAVGAVLERVVRPCMEAARTIASDRKRVLAVVESQFYAVQPVCAIVQGAIMAGFAGRGARVHASPGDKRDTLVNAVLGNATTPRGTTYDQRRQNTVAAVERLVAARPEFMPEPWLTTWRRETRRGALSDLAVAVTMALREVVTEEGGLDRARIGLPPSGGLPDVGRIRHGMGA